MLRDRRAVPARLAGVAVAGAIGLLAWVGAASADGPPRAFYGVVPQDQFGGADLERMKAGRLGTVRMTLPWSHIDPSALPDDYDWSQFDALVADASRQRITVLPTVYSVPRWLARLEGCEEPAWICTITAPRSDFALGEWRSFVSAAVRRYGPGGEFWTLNPNIPRRPIRAWQIWNEPNSRAFYQPQPDVQAYAELLTVAADAIRGVDPGAEVLLAGLWRYPMAVSQGGIRGSDFLAQLYEQPGIEAAFDGIAIHPYSERMSGVKAYVRRMIGIATAADDEDVGTWITELGWASGGGAHPLNRGPAGQARRLEQAFRWFTAKRRVLDLRLVAWYAWRDLAQREVRHEWWARTGLFRAGHLQPKPAWESLIGITGGR
jgi:Glycosyl hydrolase catalytic core